MPFAIPHVAKASKTVLKTYITVRSPLENKFHSFIFEVKSSLDAIWQGKIIWVGVINTLVARASTRIEDVICFQEALMRFSKLGFPVAHR